MVTPIGGTQADPQLIEDSDIEEEENNDEEEEEEEDGEEGEEEVEEKDQEEEVEIVDDNGQFAHEVVLKNWLQATERVTVEQFFGRLKQWRLCGQRMRNRALMYFEKFLFCIIVMCKFIRKPLRK